MKLPDDALTFKIPDKGIDFYAIMDAFERKIIMKAVLKAEWNLCEAARMLRMNRGTLHTILKKKGIHRPGGR